jgi:hypothetical protein
LYTSGYLASNANAFSHLFPYIDSLWFGEGFDYTLPYDYWFVAISGIPFGLFGEMLGPGNPYYGMTFGITARYLVNNADPSPIWSFWDYFGIQDSEMIGWWRPDCPVLSNYEDVIVTVYKKDDSALLAIANWNYEDVEVQLFVDWTALGLDEKKCVFLATEIRNFQNETTFQIDDSIPIAANSGWLLIIQAQ